MNRSRAATFVVVVAVTCLGFTALGSTANAQPSEAERLLAKVESRYKAVRGLSADFEQSFSGPGIRQKTETGRLFLARPRRMRWEYSEGKLFVVNNREGWLYSPSDRQATRFDAAAVADPRVPFLFLLGQSDLRREMERVELIPEAQAGGATSSIRLVPRNKRLGVTEIVLTATPRGEIASISFTEVSGAVSLVRLYNIREGYIAPAEAFKFQPPTGVSIRTLSR